MLANLSYLEHDLLHDAVGTLSFCSDRLLDLILQLLPVRVQSLIGLAKLTNQFRTFRHCSCSKFPIELSYSVEGWSLYRHRRTPPLAAFRSAQTFNQLLAFGKHALNRLAEILVFGLKRVLVRLEQGDLNVETRNPPPELLQFAAALRFIDHKGSTATPGNQRNRRALAQGDTDICWFRPRTTGG